MVIVDHKQTVIDGLDLILRFRLDRIYSFGGIVIVDVGVWA